MYVSFQSAEAALRFGAPTDKEKRAIEAFTAGDICHAERLLDEAVIENPSRLRYIHLVVVPPEQPHLLAKYIHLRHDIESGTGQTRLLAVDPRQAAKQELPSYEDAVGARQVPELTGSCVSPRPPAFPGELLSQVPNSNVTGSLEKTTGMRKRFKID